MHKNPLLALDELSNNYFLTLIRAPKVHLEKILGRLAWEGNGIKRLLKHPNFFSIINYFPFVFCTEEME
jgi:hypothetical protein